MVRVTHTRDVRVQRLERVLGVGRRHAHRLRDLLVDYNVNLDALLCLALQDSVKAPLGVIGRRAAKEELWRKPPVLSCTYKTDMSTTKSDITTHQDEDTFLGTVKHLGQRPEVVASVNVPMVRVRTSL